MTLQVYSRWGMSYQPWHLGDALRERLPREGRHADALSLPGLPEVGLPLQLQGCVSGSPGNARVTVERRVGMFQSVLRQPIRRHAAQPADSTSACSSTVRVAFSCLSGG